MILYLLIGIPGSGKTTLAKQISKEIGAKFFEADSFFYDKNEKYNFNPKLLGVAHFVCQKNVENELKAGNSVIVSNTNLKKRDRKIYINLAKKYNAKIDVRVCSGNFKNVHGVPDDKIEQMKAYYEPFSEDEIKNF